jgi:hypothetical protein
VVPTKSSEVNAYNHDGSVLWTRWIANNVFFTPSPALADFDGDGTLETVIASSNRNLYIISSNGSNYPGWPIPYSTVTYTESSPVVADMDGDGSLDIILGDESKFLSVWDINGNMHDGFPIATGDFVRATPTIADVDLDADVEIILAGWDKNLYIWDLKGYVDPLLKCWPTFHANVYRDGEYGSLVITGIEDASSTVQVVGKAVDITWSLGPLDPHRYDLYRGELIQDEIKNYVLIAGDLAPGEAGTIHTIDQQVELGRHYIYRLQRVDDPELAAMSDPVYVPITRAELRQNYPNPFNPSTRIAFLIPEGQSQQVSLVIYNVAGAKVKTLVNGIMKPGRYESVWNGRNDRGETVGSGVYFYRLQQRNFVDTKKMILLK